MYTPTVESKEFSSTKGTFRTKGGLEGDQAQLKVICPSETLAAWPKLLQIPRATTLQLGQINLDV